MQDQEYGYTSEYVTHDIPGYEYMFLREDAEYEHTVVGTIMMFSKITGEVIRHMSVDEYCAYWANEVQTNPKVNAYYKKGYSTPKKSPDTATSMANLLRLCSDKTRHKKGEDSYLLDFIWSKSLSVTETELFRVICDQVVVWNYAVLDETTLPDALGKDTKYTRRLYKALQDKGLIRVLSTKFDDGGQWKSFIKVHPRLYWKGRISAWKAAIGAEYEYEDSIKLS